jgi:hypothetical protein
LYPPARLRVEKVLYSLKNLHNSLDKEWNMTTLKMVDESRWSFLIIKDSRKEELVRFRLIQGERKHG